MRSWTVVAFLVSLLGSGPASAAYVDASTGMGWEHAADQHYHTHLSVTWGRSNAAPWTLSFTNQGEDTATILASGSTAGAWQGGADSDYLLYATDSSDDEISWFLVEFGYDLVGGGFETLYAPSGGASGTACSVNLSGFSWGSQ